MGQRLAPVAAGTGGIALGVEDECQATVCTGLLVLLAGLGSDAKRGSVVGAGLVELVPGEDDFTETVERLSLSRPVTGLAAQCQGLLVGPGGRVGLTQCEVHQASACWNWLVAWA